jgi:enolase
MNILHVSAQELLDSRGNPTLEVTVQADRRIAASGMVPSGASKGKCAAVELRDNDPGRYLGKGVLQAVRNVAEIIAPAIIGFDVTDQRTIDRKMIELDGTDNKSRLGANAILAVSVACMRAGALAQGIPLYQYIAELHRCTIAGLLTMPVPLVNVLNGGAHAPGAADFREYMIVPLGAPTFAEAVRWAAEIFQHLRNVIADKGRPTSVGDEGGYAPPVSSNEEPLQLLMAAIEGAGCLPGEEVAVALDLAASEFHEDDTYYLKRDGMELSSAELVDLLTEWTGRYPIVSIEDGLAHEDWDGFALLKQRTGNRIQIVGDDLFVTHPDRVRIGIERDAANSLLVKANQIGTITETLETIDLAQRHDMTTIISHRSGETEMPFEADFAVGTGAGQIKAGSLSRSERVAEYNQLMRIERHLSGKASLAVFPFAHCVTSKP